MQRLINDLFVRRLVQVLLLLSLLTMLAFQGLYLFFVIGNVSGVFSSVSQFQTILFQGLQFPFKEEFASFIPIFVGILPAIFTSVCFQVGGSPPGPTDALNRVGHIALVILVLGIIAGIASVIVSGLFKLTIDQMANLGSDGRVAIRDLFAALLAFQGLYAVQLFSLRK